MMRGFWFERGSISRTAAAAAFGYALGTFPSAWLASRLSTRKTDLTLSGTANPGTYNAYRNLGKRWGIAVGIGDVGKGAVAAGLGRMVGGDNGCYAAASTSVLGHVFPPGRRGGRGVATSFGSCLVAFPVYAPVDVGLAGTVAFLNRGAASGSRVRPAVLITTSVFLGAAGLWAWRRLPNPGGPRSGPGLLAYAAITSAALIARWIPDQDLPIGVSSKHPKPPR